MVTGWPARRHGRPPPGALPAGVAVHRPPTRPATAPQHLTTRLAALGIPTRATRNAALLQLAAEVPPTVLADLLGLHPHTAVAWVKVWPPAATGAGMPPSEHEHPPSRPQ